MLLIGNISITCRNQEEHGDNKHAKTKQCCYILVGAREASRSSQSLPGSSSTRPEQPRCSPGLLGRSPKIPPSAPVPAGAQPRHSSEQLEDLSAQPLPFRNTHPVCANRHEQTQLTTHPHAVHGYTGALAQPPVSRCMCPNRHQHSKCANTSCDPHTSTRMHQDITDETCVCRRSTGL